MWCASGLRPARLLEVMIAWRSDVVQSGLHLSSACADEARTPQLRAAGQTTGIGPGITDVLGVRQRVQGARAPWLSGSTHLRRPLAILPAGSTSFNCSVVL